MEALPRPAAVADVLPAMVFAASAPISPTAFTLAPSESGVVMSPGSFMQAAAVSKNRRDVTTSSVSTSRCLGVHAPTALMCVPGATHFLFKMGEVAPVKVQTMSAFFTAAGTASNTFTSSPVHFRICFAARFALLASLPQMWTQLMGRTHLIASTCFNAWVPVPNKHSVFESPRARKSVATAEAAAVLMAVTSCASEMESNRPDEGSVHTPASLSLLHGRACQHG